MDKAPNQLEGFVEDIEFEIASYKSNQNYVPISDIFDHRILCIWTERFYRKLTLCDYLTKGIAFQATVTVMPVMEALEILTLPL